MCLPLCSFRKLKAQVSHLALCSVHWQTGANERAHLSPSPACSSSSSLSFSTATDPLPMPGRDRRGNGGTPSARSSAKRGGAEVSEAPGPGAEVSGPWGELRRPGHRRRMTLALHHSASPKCSSPKPAGAPAEGGCVQRKARNSSSKSRPRPRTIAL